MSKVFKRMVVPKYVTDTDGNPRTWHASEVEPMIAFWAVTHHLSELDPCFQVSLDPPRNDFAHVTVFSMSAYLRSLHREGIERGELEMPNVKKRLDLIDGLVSR